MPKRRALLNSWALPDQGLTIAADRGWDALLLCDALFLLTSVGRIHNLFPALVPFKPLLVSGILATTLYLLDTSQPRRLDQLRSPTTTYVLALLTWVAVCIPTALWQGGSFHVLTDDFIKTVLMYLVIVGSVRGLRDIERLTFVYFLAAAIYAAVVVMGSGGRSFRGQIGRAHV